MKNPIPDLAPGQRWRHCKTGGAYTIIGTARHASLANTPEHILVIYRDRLGTIWARYLDEWHRRADGTPRFTLIEGDHE